MQAHDEALRIGKGRLARRADIEAEFFSGMACSRNLLCQRALPHLPCASDEYDPRVSERFEHQRLGVARNMSVLGGIDGFKANGE